ncbi:MAG TPA: LysM peptidoglycan-binding domain-containing protein [Anaerolineales bacterium]|nr:LysM peptidoglycan-binding domain-containing protein [Anaerolineales bacterium]
MEQLQKGSLIATFSTGNMDILDFQYNPTEFGLEKSVQTQEINIPGLDTPLLQFVRGQDEKLTLELFFDTTDNGMGTTASSVTELTDPFYALAKIEPGGHTPPLVSFLWNSKFPGSHLPDWTGGSQSRPDFTGVIESIRQKFSLFNSQGVPLRATLTIVIKEYKTLQDQMRQLNLTSPDRTHSHVVRTGDTLSGISSTYYHKPGDWRAIADANEIEDPRRLAPGTFLTIPPASL